MIINPTLSSRIICIWMYYIFILFYKDKNIYYLLQRVVEAPRGGPDNKKGGESVCLRWSTSLALLFSLQPPGPM
jgi:hypothetical protein